MKIHKILIALLAVTILAAYGQKRPTPDDILNDIAIVHEDQLFDTIYDEQKRQQSQGNKYDRGFLGFKENMSVKEVTELAAGFVEEGKLSFVDDSTYTYNFIVDGIPFETEVNFNFRNNKLRSIFLSIDETFDSTLETAKKIALKYVEKHIATQSEDAKGKVILTKDGLGNPIFTIVRGKVSVEIKPIVSLIFIRYRFSSFSEQSLNDASSAGNEKDQIDDL